MSRFVAPSWAFAGTVRDRSAFGDEWLAAAVGEFLMDLADVCLGEGSARPWAETRAAFATAIEAE